MLRENQELLQAIHQIEKQLQVSMVLKRQAELNRNERELTVAFQRNTLKSTNTS